MGMASPPEKVSTFVVFRCGLTVQRLGPRRPAVREHTGSLLERAAVREGHYSWLVLGRDKLAFDRATGRRRPLGEMLKSMSRTPTNYGWTVEHYGPTPFLVSQVRWCRDRAPTVPSTGRRAPDLARSRSSLSRQVREHKWGRRRRSGSRLPLHNASEEGGQWTYDSKEPHP